MRKMKRIKKIVGALIIAVLVLGNIFIPLQSALAYDSSGAVAVARGAYYDLPKTVENYASSGKTLEFDLNFQIKSSDNCKLRLYDGSSQVSGEFLLQNGEAGLKMSTESIEDGWYHYIISLLSVPRSAEQETSSVSRIRVATTFPTGSKINNISIGQDVQVLPESLTDDYDTVTLADLGIAGTDYKTAVSSGTYTYKGKSKTNSVIVKLGWEANVSSSVDWKLALDTYWNANCMVWFRPDYIYFCPGDGDYRELYERISPVTSGKHEIEFGRMRVTAGPNSDKDYVFLKIDGQVRAYKYTDYYQTEGGYVSHSGKTTVPSYTVCFVNDGVAMQGFSGFAEPDKYVTDVDYVNIGEIVPGGVVKDTIHDNYLGYTYPFTGSSKTHSTVVKYVLKTSQYAEGNLDGSVMVVDIGGNCGFCRSYISSGNKKSIMFGWEIEGCSSGTKSFTFEAKNWYAFEQGRLRVTSGVNKGKDYIYIKIDGKVISSFYGEPDSRPLLGDQIYVEATQSFQVTGYDEARAKYYVDGELYLDSLAQKGLTLKKPKDPQKNNNYFVGWYTKESGGTLFDFEKQTITSDINLYARFTSETVTLNFDPANGGIAYNVPSGKDCLVSEPTAPTYSDGTYEYVFAGWKNKATGKIFDFATERLSEDAEFVAVYKEKEYYVSYYANGKLVKKVPFVLSDPTVSGKEPAVPSIPNTTGVWEDHSVSGLKGNMTVNAVYTVKVPSSTTAVALTKYSGSKVYLNTDTIHDFLSTDTDKQSDYVREFCASPHEYQDYQNTSFAWTDSGKNSKYTVYFADNSDFKDAYIVTSKSTSLVNKVGIFLPGKTYYWFVCGNDTGKCSAVDSFKTVDTPIRYITAGNVINMRDLGGQVNGNGERVKYELVYRGAALDEFTSHVDDTARGVFNYLGINSEIELRGGMNHSYTGWDENNPNVNYIKGAMYQEILELDSEQIAQYKSTFEAMADKNNYPFYFHCSAGADRTGTFAYLLYGLLGVPYDDIRPEYELTSFSAIGVRPADDYHNGFAIDTTNSQMLEKYGEGTGNLQTAIRNFLMNKVGLSAATLDAIKNIMLDDGSSQNEKPYTLTVDVLGKKYTYKAFDGIYFMPDSPQAMGKIFKGFYNGSTKYNGYAKSDLNLTAKFEDISYEPYDTISLDDLGIEENKIINQTNKVYRYEKLVKGGTGGRLLQFILEPIGDMKNGDGPQLAITNDWSVNSYARAWFQTNTMSYAYYNGVLGSGPDVSKMVSLKAGKQYNIEFAVRVMKNKGYEGKKVFEITIDGELLVQYIGCQADLSDNMIFFHGAEGSAYLINKPVSDRHTVTVNVLGKKYTSRAMDGVYFMPEAPKAAGKIFKGFYNGKKKYDGYANGDISLTAKFEDIQYESYDTLTLRDLGVQEVKILNQTNTVYTYDKKAKSGGRLLRFVIEPIGDMKGGDGPHVALTNDWNENSNARVWFQSNEWTHVYYSGTLGTPPDISKELSLEAGKQYNVEFSVRVMKNKGYEGKKVLEVTVNGELIAQYIGCKADLSENKIYFHGATGAVYLSNLTSYKIHTLTIDVLGKKFDYPAFEGVYSMPNTPQAPGKIFTGFYNGKKKYDGYAKSDLKLTAKFDKIEYESYDTLTLRDLGVQEVKILNQTNTVYTYDKKAKSGGRLLRFILEPIGDMKGGDGPQLALTNDWNENSNARIWFQSNEWTQVYYSGTLGTPPDISKKLPLEAGKEYKIEYSVRIMKNKGYEGKKILEVTVNGELLVQYIGCKADLSENKIYFHGATGAAYLSNLTSHKIHTLTIDVLGKKFDYPAFEGVYSMPNTPQAPGKIFKGFYNGKKKYDGYAKSDLKLTAKFDKIEYESYDTLTLRDLGVQEVKILNQTNTVYTYDKKAKSGGRLLRFILEPIGDMKGGDGPQLALTNDWNENSNARVWFQSNEWTQVYYSGTLGTPPDISKKLPLEAGKEYKIEYSVRIMKNKGYEGKKIFEVTVNGELLVQYIGCKADLSENKIYFHGATGAAYLSNLTSHKIHTLTIDVLGKKFEYPAFEGVYSMPNTPQAPGKIFRGFYNGKTKYNGYTKKDLTLTAKFEDIKYEAYDTITLRDLGVQEEKILNQTNTVYTYDKKAKSGGRLLRFIMEPIGDMKGGDGPQLALTNDWNENSNARIWFQSNEWTQVYYSGTLGTPPDISKKLPLEAGKEYKIEYSVRIMKNKGYEGKKILEVTVNGELLVQYIGCKADLSENKIYFHGATGAAYLSNLTSHKIHTLTIDVLGSKFNYPAFEGVYSMPDSPKAPGKLFKGFYDGKTKYNGYTKKDLNLTAKFEDIEFEPYDTLTLRDLGVQENKILNQTNTVYTYEKTAKSGGRLLQFILEPIGDMKGGDGPQLALTNDWEQNSAARVWFQSNEWTQVYYSGKLGNPPDISQKLSLEAGKQYNIKFSVRVMKNKGYEGKKIFEITVNGELLVQYIGCTADLSENKIYFHGGTGSAYLINKPVYKTVKFYNGNTLMGTYKVERCSLIPKVEEPEPQGGLPFAGWYSEKSGGKLWDENADPVYQNMSLYAHFANVRVIKAKIDGKTLIYRVPVGETLDSLPKPQKSGHVFMGWTVNGKIFDGKVTRALTVEASFEEYSFDDYDELSLRDLGVSGKLYTEAFGDNNNEEYHYYKAAKTGGRVFKAIYVPTENMMNGPQISFSHNWDENYFSKLYFTKYDKLYVYSSGIDGGLPTLTLDTELVGGKKYPFEIGVRVLNNKGYKGIKVLTVYLNGKLIFEEFDNGTNLDGDVVFFQGLPKTGYFLNVDVYKTVSFYDGDKLLSSQKILRGKTVNSIGKLANKGDRLFMSWVTEFGKEWNFDTDAVYLDTVLLAKYQKRTYPVLLMVDDVLYKRLNITVGECVDVFDVPKKEGYDFERWLSEDGSEYDMQTPVNSPLVLVASFAPAKAKTEPIGNIIEPDESSKASSPDFIYILLGAIGLVIIAAEVFAIVYIKRSKK